MSRGWTLALLVGLLFASQGSADYQCASGFCPTPSHTSHYYPPACASGYCHTPHYAPACSQSYCQPYHCQPYHCHPIHHCHPCGTIIAGSVVVVVTGPAGLTELKVTADTTETKTQCHPMIFVSVD